MIIKDYPRIIIVICYHVSYVSIWLVLAWSIVKLALQKKADITGNVSSAINVRGNIYLWNWVYEIKFITAVVDKVELRALKY